MHAERLTVLTQTLRDQRRGLILWALGIVAVAAMYSSFYPTYHNNAALTDPIKDLPEGLINTLGFGDLTSGPGYLRSTVFGLLIPILVIVFATIFGSRAIAGEEEAGTLDLYLAYPLSRTRLILSRFAALVIPTLGFGVLTWIEVTIFSHLLDMNVSSVKIAATCLGMALMSITFGTLALTVGGVSGRRSVAVGIAAVFAVASFLAFGLGPQSDATDFLKYLSPFYYYLSSEPLRNGFSWLHIAVLVVVPLVLVGVCVAAFNRRDLNV